MHVLDFFQKKFFFYFSSLVFLFENSNVSEIVSFEEKLKTLSRYIDTHCMYKTDKDFFDFFLFHFKLTFFFKQIA